jgi:hypothetical protein
MALLISCRPELISSNIAVDMMDNAKGVAHMPTATTTKEDSDSKSGQNHPHDFTKRRFYLELLAQALATMDERCVSWLWRAAMRAVAKVDPPDEIRWAFLRGGVGLGDHIRQMPGKMTS